MNKKAFLEFIKKYGLIAVTYLKNEFGESVKEAFRLSWKFFVDTLWNSIKDEVNSKLKSTVKFIEFYFNSTDYEEKEKAVIDTLMKNISLPLPLKPFRGVLKKILKNKLKKVVSKSLKKLNTLT